jgi:hypothetical protein
MSIRRRINTSIVDIWVTNNSNDVNIIGSLRWAIAQASNTEHTYIKVSPDFIDLEGVGRNMYVAGTRVTNVFGGSLVKNITIDFSYTNVIFGTGGGFVGHNDILSPTLKLQNMVVENQDFGTPTSALFSGMIEYINCRFENLVSNFLFFEYVVTSTTTNCIFRNVVGTSGIVFNYVNGTHTVDNCIFDNTTGFTGNATVNYSRCYINISNTFTIGNINPIINFSQCYIRNSGTSTSIGLYTRTFGAVTNCTFVNMRITTGSGFGEKPSNIRHCTQIYTLPITATTILNIINTGLAHTIQNNIFISPNSNNIFATTLSNLTESNNLYLCANPNAVFPNSTHFGANTPITTLIDTNEQGIGETFKRYYLPTLTNNVARLADVLQNQIEQNRNNPTNIGAI